MGLITITIGADTLLIGDSAGVAPNNVVALKNIVRVGAYFQANKVNGMGQSYQYGYGGRTQPRTTGTVITLYLQHGQDITFDCDNVSNQPTWQGGTLAALNTCVADLNAAL